MCYFKRCNAYNDSRRFIRLLLLMTIFLSAVIIMKWITAATTDLITIHPTHHLINTKKYRNSALFQMLNFTSIPVSSDISTTSIIAAAISCFSCTASLSHCFIGSSKGFVSIALRLRHIVCIFYPAPTSVRAGRSHASECSQRVRCPHQQAFP